jgi:hypothetical protein
MRTDGIRTGRSGRARCAWLVAVAALSLGVGSASAETPAIVGPTAGQELAVGSTGPLQVQWDEAGDYVLRVTGPGGHAWSLAVSIAEPGSIGYPFAPLPRPGDYTATVESPGGSVLATVAFRAVGVNVAAFLAPSQGSKHVAGFSGPARVRIEQIRWPAATLDLRLNDHVVCSWTAANVVGKTMSCPLPALAAGDYELEVQDAQTGLSFAWRSFSVLPRLLIRSRSASPRAFFPLVRDGYRDTTTFRFALNQPANVTVRVRNAAGKVVRTASLGRVSSGTWRWNGRTRSGKKLPPGTYRIDLLASNGLERKRSSAVSVRVKTAFVNRNGSKSFCGICGPGRVFVAPNCWAVGGYFHDDDLFIGCDGGDYAIATFVYSIPASTFKISFKVVGRQYCCWVGPVLKVGERIKPKRYRVAVGVGGYRSLDIHRVSISYKYKVRI